MVTDDLIMDNDMQIDSGDWKIADATNQNIFAIVKTRKGQFYQYPLLGVGIEDHENASVDRRTVRREIRTELKKDHYTIQRLDIIQTADNIDIAIDATKLK